MMTFEQFQATKQVVGDLAVALPFNADLYDGRVVPGLVYLGELSIEKAEGNCWSLTIGNIGKVSPDLVALERDLYAFAQSEGYFEVSKAQLETAAANDDLDAALLPIMNLCGIEDGGVAGQVFSGFDWPTATKTDRMAKLEYWLRVEGAYEVRVS
jgi:hypothetical protein